MDNVFSRRRELRGVDVVGNAEEDEGRRNRVSKTRCSAMVTTMARRNSAMNSHVIATDVPKCYGLIGEKISAIGVRID